MSQNVPWDVGEIERNATLPSVERETDETAHVRYNESQYRPATAMRHALPPSSTSASLSHQTTFHLPLYALSTTISHDLTQPTPTPPPKIVTEKKNLPHPAEEQEEKPIPA